MRASAGESAAAATTGRATAGWAVTGPVPGAPGPVGAAGGPIGPGGEPAAAGDAAGPTGTGGGAIWPRGTVRKTISTPFFSGSFSTACSRRKSIASRMLASRNSTRGIMMVFNLLVIRAVPPVSLAKPAPTGAVAMPYLWIGSPQAFSTFQSWRARVSLYASSPYLYLMLSIFSWPRRAATLYGSRLRTCSYRLNARSYRPDW